MSVQSQPGISRPQLIAALRCIATRLSSEYDGPELSVIEAICHPRNEVPQRDDLAGFACEVRGVVGPGYSIRVSLTFDGDGLPYYALAYLPGAPDQRSMGCGATLADAVEMLRKNYKPAPTFAQRKVALEAELAKLNQESVE